MANESGRAPTREGGLAVVRPGSRFGVGGSVRCASPGAYMDEVGGTNVRLNAEPERVPAS